jgi:hypothetical protein
MDAGKPCLNEQSDVSPIKEFINSIHIFSEDVPLATESFDNVSLRCAVIKNRKF